MSVASRTASSAAAAVLLLLIAASAPALAALDDGYTPPTPAQVLDGLKQFYQRTARPEGSFSPGVDPDYLGMSDSAHSDLAAVTYACTIHKTFGWRLPNEEKTVEFLLSRQRETGEFFNVAGTVDPKSAEGRTYNTTQGLVALHALGVKPKYDPLPVFEEILKQDYKTLPAFSTSFFPLAYGCVGKPVPPQADRGIRALMVQDETGYTNDHVAATFHASHYYALVGEPTPKSRPMVDRILRDQKSDGSWLINSLSRDRHATFDAVFTLFHEGHDRPECRAAVARAAKWALTCRNADGGFGHFPGSTSDADAVYFQVGTLVMAGFLKPADPLPPDPHLLSWGHLMPVHDRNTSRIRLELPAWVAAVAFGHHGGTLATGSADNVARLWDAQSGKLVMVLKGHDDVVSAVAFTPDDKLVVTGSYDRTVRVWDAAKGELRRTLGGHRGAVVCVVIAPDRPLVASGSIDRTIKLWDLSAEGTNPVRTLEGHKSWVNAVAFDSTGKLLVSGSSDGTVKVWDVTTGECRRTLAASKAEVRSVAIAPDGGVVAAGLRYGAIKLWSTTDWAEHSVATGLAGDVWSLTFTADGRLVSGSGDWNQPGFVTFWDALAAKPLDRWRHTGEVLAVAVSPSNGRIAAAGGDKTVTIRPGLPGK